MVEETRASGKRRRGAYQRHLLIYFAAVGRSAVHGRRGSSLGFAPTNLSPLPLARSVCTRDDYKRDRGHRCKQRFPPFLGERGQLMALPSAARG